MKACLSAAATATMVGVSASPVALTAVLKRVRAAPGVWVRASDSRVYKRDTRSRDPSRPAERSRTPWFVAESISQAECREWVSATPVKRWPEDSRSPATFETFAMAVLNS
jgi:hypothetical protein